MKRILLVAISALLVASPAFAQGRSIRGYGVNGATVAVDLCGQNDENGTIYLGPVVTDHFLSANAATVDASIAGTVCDALDSATEATADAPVITTGLHAVALYCVTNGTLGASETLTYTLRSSEADTTPVISCSLAEGETECVSLGYSAPIAAGATLAVEAVEASDNADDDSWCRAWFTVDAGSG